jgi:hypothetical protein
MTTLTRSLESNAISTASSQKLYTCDHISHKKIILFKSGMDFNAHNLFYHGITTNEPDNISDSVIEKIKTNYMKVYHKIEVMELQRKQIKKEYEEYTSNEILFDSIWDKNSDKIKFRPKFDKSSIWAKEIKTTHIIRKNRLRPKALKMENKIRESHHKQNILYMQMNFIIREIESYKINEDDIYYMSLTNTTLSEFNKNRGIENE